MTQTVSAAEVKAAGGLAKWLAKVAQSPAITNSSKRKEDKLADLRNLASLPQAKGRRPADPLLGYDAERMNGLEARYAGYLEGLRRTGQIILWRFEAVTLRLADKTAYNPDFLIMLPDGALGFHETKGHWRDDARAKIKIAAEQFPWFFFLAVQWDRRAGDWKREWFRRGNLC